MSKQVNADVQHRQGQRTNILGSGSHILSPKELLFARLVWGLIVFVFSLTGFSSSPLVFLALRRMVSGKFEEQT